MTRSEENTPEVALIRPDIYDVSKPWPIPREGRGLGPYDRGATLQEDRVLEGPGGVDAPGGFVGFALRVIGDRGRVPSHRHGDGLESPYEERIEGMHGFFWGWRDGPGRVL